jgi:catechol 2,3-dioxygenase-like lactoylglutathione lyase family enzyme
VSTGSGEFPTEGVILSHLLVVADLDRSVVFYRDVLGARLERVYGGSTGVLEFAGSWILLTTAGEPTTDKPDVTFVPPPTDDPGHVSHEFTIRVPDCRAAYEVLLERGAVFLTPPHDWGYETRCFFRDPDGNLLEISSIPG